MFTARSSWAYLAAAMRSTRAFRTAYGAKMLLAALIVEPPNVVQRVVKCLA